MNLLLIKSKRLLFRALRTSDWESISYLRSDPAINRYVDRPSAHTKEEALAFINKIDKEIALGKILYWAISLVESEDMIVSICLWNFSEDRKTAEMGYDLMPSYQRKGIMDESVKLILQQAKDNLELEQVSAHTHRENTPSRKLLERNGFIHIPDASDSNPNNVIYHRFFT